MEDHPEIWHRMGAYIHQDFIQQFPDFGSGIDDFFSEEPEHLKADLLAHLQERTRQGAAMDRLWNESGTSIMLQEADAARVIGAIMDYLSGAQPNVIIDASAPGSP